MAERALHRTSVEIFPVLPAEVGAGGTVTRRARVACSFGCSLRGALIRVVDGEGEDLMSAPLTTFRQQRNETDAFSLTAPREAGEWRWEVIFDGHEGEEGIDHAPAAAAVATQIGVSDTSLAVWGVPSPVIAGQRFSLKVGAKSSAGHPLTGCRFEVRGQDGALVSEGAIGDAPWPGAEGLYWDEVEATAPPAPGSFVWSVHFAASEAETPHGGASVAFGFTTMPPPEAQLSVSVVDKESGAPIGGAEVRLRAISEGEAAAPPLTLRAVTGEDGNAVIAAPRGSFQLTVWKPHHRIPTMPVELEGEGESAVTVEAEFAPKKKKEQVWM